MIKLEPPTEVSTIIESKGSSLGMTPLECFSWKDAVSGKGEQYKQSLD
ncbi:hypothetical protein J2T17_003614 [Paenibacillus mucilaginosus]